MTQLIFQSNSFPSECVVRSKVDRHFFQKLRFKTLEEFARKRTNTNRSCHFTFVSCSTLVLGETRLSEFLSRFLSPPCASSFFLAEFVAWGLDRILVIHLSPEFSPSQISLGGFGSCVFVALMACLFTVSLLVVATGLGVFIRCLGFMPVQGVILLYVTIQLEDQKTCGQWLFDTLSCNSFEEMEVITHLTYLEMKFLQSCTSSVETVWREIRKS